MNFAQSDIHYSGSWGEIFGSSGTEIATDLPLWIVQDGGDPDLSKHYPLIGGWPYATGKQWNLQTDAYPCGGTVDLDSFALSDEPKVLSTGSGLGQLSSCKTTSDGLKYRSCPKISTDCVAMGQYPIGTSVDFICKTPGDQVFGDWSTK